MLKTDEILKEISNKYNNNTNEQYVKLLTVKENYNLERKQLTFKRFILGFAAETCGIIKQNKNIINSVVDSTNKRKGK